MQNFDIKCSLRIVALAKNTTYKARSETVCIKYIQCLYFILKLSVEGTTHLVYVHIKLSKFLNLLQHKS